MDLAWFRRVKGMLLAERRDDAVVLIDWGSIIDNILLPAMQHVRHVANRMHPFWYERLCSRNGLQILLYCDLIFGPAPTRRQQRRVAEQLDNLPYATVPDVVDRARVGVLLQDLRKVSVELNLYT